MEQYLKINKRAYDILAEDYDLRDKINPRQQEKILKPFEIKLKKYFSGEIQVLDVGCGVGTNCYILSKHGFKTFGIDFSPKMLEFARENSPNTKFFKRNFLNFSSKQKFHGLIAGAFLNLFPSSETLKILNKFFSLLNPNGIGLIYTTKDRVSKEGIFYKRDFSKKVRRFRKFFTEEELRNVLSKAGFKIIKIYPGYSQDKKKDWICVLFQKI